VRAWRTFIHIGSCDGAKCACCFYDFVNFFGRRYILLRQIFYEHSSFLIRSYFQIVFILVQKIFQFLHVQFSQRYLYSELYMLLRFRNRTEYVLHHTRNYTWVLSHLLSNLTLHSVRLSRWSLSVSKNSAIEAFHDTIDDWGSRIIVDFALSRLNIKDSIKVKLECFFIVLSLFVADGDGFII
jgi:hypothetical protein